MRTTTKGKLAAAAAGSVGIAVVACNAITGLDANYNQLDCFGASCADASTPDGSRPDAMTGIDHNAPPPDGQGMPDGTMADTGSDAVADAGVDAPSCNPQAAWANMFDAAIVPPYRMLGLDLHGDDDAGITISQVAQAACEVNDGGSVAPGMWSVSWGQPGTSTTNPTAYFQYDRVLGRYDELLMGPGYTGALDFKSADGGAKYHIDLNGPITKNGAPFELDWAGPSDAGVTFAQEATELRNAMVATYAPGTPPSADCTADLSCLACGTGCAGAGGAEIGIRAPIFFYMVFGDAINHPSQPSYFYSFTPYTLFNDFTEASTWTAFDTTQLGANVKAFAGVEYDSIGAIYLVPSGATPFARYATASDAFTVGTGASSGWSTFNPSQLTPKPTGFSGGAFNWNDGEFSFFAGTTGICVQYDNGTSFELPSAWSSFDTTQLPAPKPTGFAGVTTPFAGGAVFVPANDGIAAYYNSANYIASDYTVAANWVTYDLATINARLSKFHGAVSYGSPFTNSPLVYLIPHADTLMAMFDVRYGFNESAGWTTFDLATLPGSIPAGQGYSTGVTDGRYIYFSPGSGGHPVRYDTTLPFTQATSWEVGLGTVGETTATSFDGQYVYFSGPSSTISRYDTTQNFTTQGSAWTSVNVANFNANALAFNGSAGDGRYWYFVPETFSTLMRFDAKFPQRGPPVFASYSTY